METLHSPAPWRACHDGNCQCGQIWSTAADSCVALALDAEDNEFGEACKVPYKSAEFYANMRLIAAAPEMLESLLNLVGMFDTPAGRRKQTDIQKEALALAHKAIEKAINGKSE